MKSPLPHLESHPDQQADINTLLSLVEDIIRQQNQVPGNFYTDTSKRDHTMVLSLGAVKLQGAPEPYNTLYIICLFLCISKIYTVLMPVT